MGVIQRVMVFVETFNFQITVLYQSLQTVEITVFEVSIKGKHIYGSVVVHAHCACVHKGFKASHSGAANADNKEFIFHILCEFCYIFFCFYNFKVV